MSKYKFLQTGQLPWEHLSFLQNLLNFFITKYLKQVDDDLSIWVDKRSSCGLYNWRYKDLLRSRDQKLMTLLSQWRSALSTSIMELVLLHKFDNIKIKRFVIWLWGGDITTAWGGVPYGTLSVILTCCPNFMFLAY